MRTTVRHARAPGWIAATSAVLVSAACAGAGGSGGLGAARRQPGTISNGTFAPGRPAASSYGPDAGVRCQSGGPADYVKDALGRTAKSGSEAPPQEDARVCAVAEAFLAWDASAKPPREQVLAFASHWFGLPNAVQQVIVAEFETEEPKLVAERLVEPVQRFAGVAASPRFGIATQRVRKGTTKAALVLLDSPVEIDPFPRRMQPGQQATLSGRLLDGVSDPKVAVSDAAGRLSTPAQQPGKAFTAEVKCGDKPGPIQIEVRGEHGARSGPVASFPVACGTELPASVAVTGESWPTDVAGQERKAFEELNRERTQLGLAPLAWDDAVAKVARGVAEALSSGSSGDVRERLKAEGIVSPLVLQSAAADRAVERAQERLETSPTNRSNMLNAEVTSAGVGVHATTDAQNRPLVYVAEVFVKELPPIDVEKARSELRAAVERKRRDARAAAVKSNPLLEQVAESYARALAAGGGSIGQDEAAKITAPLDAQFKAVNMVSGAKQEPLDFAEEPQVVSSGSALGVGVAQGKHPVLGRNATYAVIMIGQPRSGAAAKPKAGKPARK